MAVPSQQYVGIDLRLPADLANALHVARTAAFGSVGLITAVRICVMAGFEASYEHLCELGQRKREIDCVLADLVPVADPLASFGSSCAHLAALNIRDRVLGFVRISGRMDLTTFRAVVLSRDLQLEQIVAEQGPFKPRTVQRIRERLPAGILDDLPNPRDVAAACEREAYAAFAARLRREGPGAKQNEPPVGSARDVPTMYAELHALRTAWRESLPVRIRPLKKRFLAWLREHHQRHADERSVKLYWAWQMKG